MRGAVVVHLQKVSAAASSRAGCTSEVICPMQFMSVLPHRTGTRLFCLFFNSFPHLHLFDPGASSITLARH